MEEKIVQRGLPGVFDYLEHTADLYIVAYGDNILDLYRNAGIALFESMTNTKDVDRVIEKRVVAEGFDLENLLYRWLEELLIIYYSENIMCSEIETSSLEIKRVNGELNYRLEGICRGEEFNPEKHEPRVEIKAVTYHLMRIVREDSEWRAYFVLDI
ncbi:MAG: archease [Desulfurococcales archaeon ex4484_58]|nr:MAG: archease [Desulfurococcales archaeon ex4484_58]